MPLQVTRLPKDAPDSTGSRKSGFGDRVLSPRIGRAVPDGSNFEYFDTVPRKAETKIELRSNVGDRPMLLQEGVKRLVNACPFNFAEHHRRDA